MKSLKSTLALLAIVSLGFGCASVTSAEYGEPTTEEIETVTPDRDTFDGLHGSNGKKPS